MKTFTQMELNEAFTYAKENPDSFAIHLHFMLGLRPPQCFKRDVKKGVPIAHVFGANKEALIALAKRLGVNRIVVEHTGTYRQHIDLCGKPLQKLLAEVE